MVIECDAFVTRSYGGSISKSSYAIDVLSIEPTILASSKPTDNYLTSSPASSGIAALLEF